jgi:hypothetical protein
MAVKAQIEHANARPWVVKSNLTSLFIGDFFSIDPSCVEHGRKPMRRENV